MTVVNPQAVGTVQQFDRVGVKRKFEEMQVCLFFQQKIDSNLTIYMCLLTCHRARIQEITLLKMLNLD